MVFGNIRNEKEIFRLEEKVRKCLEYAAGHDLKTYEKGRHEIDGEDLFVNIAEYETAAVEDRFWEAHRDYLDLHLMLQGRERIDIGFIDDMKQREYVPEDDFLPLDGEPCCSAVLNPGNFLLAYPEDGHRTGVAVKKPEKIKKAIFKIKIGTDRD